MSHRPALAFAIILVAVAAIAPAQAQRRHHKPAPKAEAPVTPKQENQFVTVEEFVRAHRGGGTPVSVEGYAVYAIKSGSGVKLALVDSVDHVLSASDANKFAAGGASATIPAGAVAKHPSWGMTAKGLARFAMYTGAGSAQKSLHDTVAKVRLTGRASGRSINVTGVEYQDDNGDWKKL